MKKLIQYAPLLMLMLISEISWSAQTDVYQQDTREDSVCIPIEQWQYIQTWAEFGFACDTINERLVMQIDQDMKRTEKMQKELDKERKRNKRNKTTVKVLIAICGVQLIAIMLLTML